MIYYYLISRQRNPIFYRYGNFNFVFSHFYQAKKGVTDKDKAAAAKKSAASGAKSNKAGKAKKKSWTKVKVKEKLNNAVFLDQKAYERITKEAPKIAGLTVSVVCDKFKVNGSVARKVLRDLHSKGLIK